MIDTNDKQTADLIGKKRGRPATGQAMTAAERKRRQRAKHSKGTLAGHAENLDPTAKPTTTLLELLSKCVSRGDFQRVQIINRELLKRARINAKNA